jgi:hypothetical protein
MNLPRMVLAVTLALFSCALAIAAAPSPSVSHRSRSPRDSCFSLPSKWQRAQCESYGRSAPGDEYFGPLKISYLGIDNTAHDVAIESGAYTTDSGLIARIRFADLALRDWERKYPRDPELPRSYFLMIHALLKIYTQPAQQEAWRYMQHVIHAFPGTYFAKLLRADASRGFTEHWFVAAQPCPTPARNQIGELAPIATPVPTPQPRAGQPRVDIMTPPCISVIIPTSTPAGSRTPATQVSIAPTSSPPQESASASPLPSPASTVSPSPSSAPG